MPVRKQDAHRALELLEDYHAKLTGSEDRQLRTAIEKVIRIFRSRLFQALLDIQEFYEETLLDSAKTSEEKTHETMEMAAAWEKQSPMPHRDKKKEEGKESPQEPRPGTPPAAALVIVNDVEPLPPPPPETTATDTFAAGEEQEKAVEIHRQAFMEESVPEPYFPEPASTEPALIPPPADVLVNKWQWEQETIVLDKGSGGLGFSIAGGYDHPHSPDDNLVYVTKIIPIGGASKDGRLRLEDCILSVNENSLLNVTHGEAVDALRHAGNRVTLVVKRKVSQTQVPASPKGESSLQKIVLVKAGKGLGFSIAGGVGNQHIPGDDGIFVTKIIDTGAAAADGHLSVGDRILKVNEGSVENVSHEDAVLALKRTDQTVILLVEKGKGEEAVHQAAEVQTPAVTLMSPPTFQTPQEPSPKVISREPRNVELTKGNQGLGFNIIGGEDNQGIFVSFILAGGAADRSGKLVRGDQILDVNGTNVRGASHGDAAVALKSAGDTVRMRVQYNPEEYAQFEAKLNDMREKTQGVAGSPSPFKTSSRKELFVRALFDYDKSKDSGLPSTGLSFQHGDILHVVNASDDEWWQARRIGPDGHEDGQGVIPSKKRVERRERSRQKSVKFSRGGSSDDKGKSPSGGRSRKRSFNIAKRLPFFKKKNREPKEENKEPEEAVLSYEEVYQEEISYTRPVIVLGPVKDRINDDLIQEYPERFGSCVPHTTRPARDYEADSRDYYFVSREDMEKGIQNHEFIEAGQYNGNLYGTSVMAVRDVAEKGKHCILDVSGYAIKRLQVASLHPIAIFIKPKSIESVREMNKRCSEDQVQKLYERAGKLEQEFAEYFTAIVACETYEDVYELTKRVIQLNSGTLIWVSRKQANDLD
eukprot:m.306928 g.306928  ORF g.306928 m.306928 type:complete len:872 (+) comp41736_c0_seq1:177-2792(+)